MPVLPLTAENVTSERTQLGINAIRFLAVDAVQEANSGHPGMPMGCAPMAYVLWRHFLKHNPVNPDWVDRDRFVLSAGHGSMLIYALLHLSGYDLPMEEVKRFRQLHSKTPGHPENFITTGVETTTGPLGQGVANGIGMAIAEKFLAARFNQPGFEIVDHHTYGIVSDGDLMEGISHEAASLAGHLGLGKLIYFYDDNEISIDGSTDLTFTEDVAARFDAYGWQTIRVDDGNDTEAIYRALESAKADTERPSLISIKTIIGFGSPNKQGTAGVHGSPLGPDEVRLAKETLGWPTDKTFYVPDQVYADFDGKDAGSSREAEWNTLFERYSNEHPALAAKFSAWMDGDLPAGWDDALPTFDAGSSMASRASSGKVLDAIAKKVENLVGGSADLTGSNKTAMSTRGDFQDDNPAGSYFRFGVREHAMASICNGMELHGGVRTFCGTFLIFSDYLRPALRLSALMGLPVTYVLTHDSIGLGEDGPTHQPVEHYMALRAIPNVNFIRPADANETAEAWKIAIQSKNRPTVLSLSRQSLPTLDQSKYGSASGTAKGAYILKDSDGTPDVILMATGSEVSIALEASEKLVADGISARVVSMPCWRLFEEQTDSYRETVLPRAVTARVAVEAGISLGWERYIGWDGKAIVLDRFGGSAPAEELYADFGITADRVAEAAKTLVG